MKNWIYAFVLLAMSCSNPKATENATKTESPIATEQEVVANRYTCYEGKLGDKIPVLLYFQTAENVVIGEIVYLNTKNRTPIKVIGNSDNGMDFRLKEYDSSGTITGIIYCHKNDTGLNGNWYSATTDKEYTLVLKQKDTSIAATDILVSSKNITGEYRYQYADEGAQGTLSIVQNKNETYNLKISATTPGPAYNMADLYIDSVTISNTEFNYTLPDTDDCAINIRFLGNFAIAKYTKGTCSGQFGHNATVEGMFLKTK